MKASKILATMLCAATFGAAAAVAQPSNPCDPRYHLITPSNCAGILAQAGKHLIEARVAIAEASAAIAAARRRFWETYPDKPGAAEARDEFGKQLYGKDVYYLWLALTEAMGGFKVKGMDMLGGKMDGGITRYSSAEFIDWVEEIARNAGPKPVTFDKLTEDKMKELSTLPERLVQAMAASESKHNAYLFERDWGEFDAAGREPVGYQDPALYFQALCVRGQKVGWDEALAEYAGIVKTLGKDNVLLAIQQVHAAPRVRFGVLQVTAPEPLMTAPSGQKVPDYSVPQPEGVIGVTASAIRAVERLATEGDDRRYLLWLLTFENRPGWRTHIEQPTKWEYAETTYHRFVVAFGEPDLLQAARLVRTATKRATSGGVMDPAAIGATRSDPFPAFADIVTRKNPRGYVRSVLAVAQKLATAPEVDAAYAKYVAATGGERAVLDGARATAASAKAQPHYEGDLERIEGMINGSHSAEAPAAALVDYPEYLAWKGFAPGAKVTYAHRVWQPEKYGSDHFLPGPVTYRHSYLLRSVNAEQAQLWFTEVINDSRTGAPRPAHDTEIAYPAKRPAGADDKTASPSPAALATAAAALLPGGSLRYFVAPASVPAESGEEALEINGKSTKTVWRSQSYSFAESSPYKECGLLVKVWTSDAVPSGLVRKAESKTCPETKTHAGSWFIEETFLESLDGSKAGVQTLEHFGPLPSQQGVRPVPSGPTPPPTVVPERTVPPRRAVPPEIQPAGSGPATLNQRYSLAIARTSRDKVMLAQLERQQAAQGIQLPADVKEARDHLDAQVKAVIGAMQGRDNDQLGQSLQALEDGLAVIEKYLKP